MSNATKRAVQNPAQSGFTLVEIAIVLVIIGLLLGGILKGQEMITQAKIKNLINDFNGLAAAMYSYQDRYRALPGDESTTQTKARWGATAHGGNGNGTFVGGTTPADDTYNFVSTAAPAAGTGETALFWMHLRLSGFVPGSTDTTAASSLLPPANSVNGLVGVQTSGMGFTSNIICTSNLPDKIAISVDTQVDDGSSIRGQVRGQKQAAPNEAAATVAPTV
ncbi:MAG: prepilin-type N-terminal cleavage/methylation domain-containing protein [Burkholderiales bacterium]